MTASEAQVAAAMVVVREHWILTRGNDGGVLCGNVDMAACKGWMTRGEFTDHLARAVADAVVAAGPDPATIAADALHEVANFLNEPSRLGWGDDVYVFPNTDLMRPRVRLLTWLRNRAAGIEADK